MLSMIPGAKSRVLLYPAIPHMTLSDEIEMRRYSLAMCGHLSSNGKAPSDA